MVWASIFDELLIATDQPITPIELELTSSRLIILAECETAPATWDLALRFKQIVTYEGIGSVVASKQSIMLGVSSQVELIEVSEPYRLRLEVPIWMPSLRLQVWEEDRSASLPVGFLMSFGGSATANTIAAFGSRWLLLTDDATRTIGNVGSGSDLAGQWIEKIFTHLWETYPARSTLIDYQGYPIARGATAGEDWIALKRLTLPDFRGSVLVAAGSTIPNGILIGSNTTSIAVSNMPSHNHPGSSNASTGSHAHTGTGASAGGHAHAGSSISSDGTHGHTSTAANAGSHQHVPYLEYAGDHAHWMGQLLVNAAVGGAAGRVVTGSPFSAATEPAGVHVHGGVMSFAGDHNHALTVAAVGNHAHTPAIAAAADHAHTLSISTSANHTHTPAIASQGNGNPISVQQLGAVEHLFISCGVAA